MEKLERWMVERNTSLSLCSSRFLVVGARLLFASLSGTLVMLAHYFCIPRYEFNFERSAAFITRAGNVDGITFRRRARKREQDLFKPDARGRVNVLGYRQCKRWCSDERSFSLEIPWEHARARAYKQWTRWLFACRRLFMKGSKGGGWLNESSFVTGDILQGYIRLLFPSRLIWISGRLAAAGCVRGIL